jgi:hypothetical protein
VTTSGNRGDQLLELRARFNLVPLDESPLGCDQQRLIMTAHARVHASGEIQGFEIVGIDLEGLVEFTQPFFRPSSIRAPELRGEVLFDAVFLDRVQQASDGDQMSLPEGRKLAQ